MKLRPRREFDDPAVGASEFLMRLAIAVLMVAGPVGALFSRRLMITLVPVCAVLMIASALLAPRRGMLRPLTESLATPLGLAALSLLAWAGASVLWTPFPALGLERFLKTLGTVSVVAAAIAILPAHVRTPNLNLLPVGLGASSLGLLLLVVLREVDVLGPEGAEPSVLERATIATSVLLWPALGALAVRERWTSAGVLALAAAAAIVATRSPAALTGLAVGALVCAIALGGARRVAQWVCLLFAVALLAGPAIAVIADRLGGGLSESGFPFLRSLAAWAWVVEEQGLRLLTGHGVDSAPRGFSTGYIPEAAPRGAVFQLWFEYGLPGAALGAILIARTVGLAGAVTQPAPGFLLAAIAAALAISTFTPIALQLWWLTIIGMAAIASALLLKGQYRTTRPTAALAAAPAPAPAPASPVTPGV